MRLIRDRSIVPVLMFHSIGPRNSAWIWSDLSESVETFEKIVAGLAASGFRTVGLPALFDHMSGKNRLPHNSIVLTLDDGYLDNWVFAVPVLRKYGMQAIVYVTPEFVEDTNEVRPTSDDLNGNNSSRSDLESTGFMSWGELTCADKEGVLDIQSHCLSHTWYFSGPQIRDFHRPSTPNPFPWLSWNAQPDRKPHYLSEDQQHFVPWGQPIFEHEKACVVRRFFPEQNRVDEIIGHIRDNGGEAFFRQSAWRKDLEAHFPQLQPGQEFPGCYETESAYAERVTNELVMSKKILEERLEKSVDYLSWPGGGNSVITNRLARKAGYKSWTLSSWQAPTQRNTAGVDPSGIKRISGQSDIFWKGRSVADGGASWVIGRVKTHQRSMFSRLTGIARKIFVVIGIATGLRSASRS